jgi:exodeoxyribonuclease VII large subunit
MQEEIEIIGKKEPISVSNYISLVNDGLKKFQARIVGEVSEAKISARGHVYFSLKDEKDRAVINCIIWGSNYNLYNIELKEGVKIVATGYPEIYPAWGKLSFISEVIEYAGEGALKKAYEELKKKLTKEGVFAEERKRPIPDYVQNVGVITSKTGAVIHDFTSNLGKFGFKIKMIDSRVEGQEAVKDLLSSIKSFRKKDIEVLVIMRGGGSLESLMGFNNERLVKEVINFPVPVIAALGHEKDVPLVSLAADKTVSTPTAAANLLSESWARVRFEVDKYERNIISLYSESLFEARKFLSKLTYKVKDEFTSILNRYKDIENILKSFLARVQNELVSKKRGLVNYSKSILKDFSASFGIFQRKLDNFDKIIALNDPKRQLRLGYSIARQSGKIIKTIKNVKIGEDINLEVYDGNIQSKVKKINKKNK